jgi:hypothetical protein
MLPGALAFAYLLATFVLSAAFVRLFPRSRLARRLRLNLGYFPLLPALLALLIARAAGTGIGHVGAKTEGLFARLSGHRQYRRYRTYYSYYLRRSGTDRRA